MNKLCIIAYVLAAQQAVRAQDEDLSEDELEEAIGHVHYVDPSMDGSCVACVGARRIYCMDGGRDGVGDVWDTKLGSCQPNWAYCTEAGRNSFAAYMNFRECYYTNVYSPNTDSYFETDMIDITITDEMA